MKRVNIGFLIVLLILIIFSYFYVTIYSKYDVMLYLNDYKEIIQLNHIIEVLLLITITFFIYKIFFRRGYVFGSVITKKLFLLLASVIVIPSLINIKIANYFIDNNFVNNYFESSFQNLVSFFTKKEKISLKELEEIKKIMNKTSEASDVWNR